MSTSARKTHAVDFVTVCVRLAVARQAAVYTESRSWTFYKVHSDKTVYLYNL